MPYRMSFETRRVQRPLIPSGLMEDLEKTIGAMLSDAQSPTCPPELMQLLTEHAIHVFQSGNRNLDSMTWEMLVRQYNGSQEYTSYAIISAPLRIEILKQMRLCLAQNPQTPIETLDALRQMFDQNYRSLVEENPAFALGRVENPGLLPTIEEQMHKCYQWALACYIVVDDKTGRSKVEASFGLGCTVPAGIYIPARVIQELGYDNGRPGLVLEDIRLKPSVSMHLSFWTTPTPEILCLSKIDE